MDKSALVIRSINNNDSMAELTELLHRAYKRLADMGFRFFASYQTVEQTRERAEDGECYVGLIDGKIVSTITFYPGPHQSDNPAWYHRPEVGYFGQFAVEPELQEKGIGGTMMEFIEDIARSHGKEELALDTSEGATHLIEYYSRRNYRFIEHVQWDITNYRSVVLSKTLV